MQVPLEITYRDVEKTDDLDTLIRDKAEKLDRICSHMTSCRIAIEQPHKNSTSNGHHFRVRIDMHVPPGHEVVVKHDSHEDNRHDTLDTLVRRTFDAAANALKRLHDQQNGRVKTHPEQETQAIVDRIFAEGGYGFIRLGNGDEVYFHRNAVRDGDWELLKPGTGVRYVAENGVKGPQATTVQIAEK